MIASSLQTTINQIVDVVNWRQKYEDSNQIGNHIWSIEQIALAIYLDLDTETQTHI